MEPQVDRWNNDLLALHKKYALEIGKAHARLYLPLSASFIPAAFFYSIPVLKGL